MPIRLRDNPYRGVNAHLQSYLQSSGGVWHSYHASLIEAIRTLLDNTLPQGYVADSEQSLEISMPFSGDPSSRTIPDILLARMKTATGSNIIAEYQPAPDVSLTLPLLDLVAELDEDAPRAVLISAVSSNGQYLPVTRIELLSPSNKPPRHGYAVYVAKRNETLRSGISVIEIDLLHQTHPLIDRMPSYPDHDPQALPFTITISYPYPDLNNGKTFIYGFSVDQPLPLVHIPLREGDHVPFNLAIPYNEVLRNKRSLTETLDYTELPLAFDSYSSADQERIRARMDIIRREHEGAANADPTP